jgi:hypothetical protein
MEVGMLLIEDSNISNSSEQATRQRVGSFLSVAPTLKEVVLSWYS